MLVVTVLVSRTRRQAARLLTHLVGERRSWRRRWPLALAVPVLLLSAYAAVTVWRTPYLGLLRSMQDEVYWVEPASPGAAAGVQVGDRLTHIDGVPIGQREPLFGPKRAGDTLTLSLVRDGTERSVDVRLAAAPLGVRLRRLGYLSIALCFWLMGVLVLVRAPAPAEGERAAQAPSVPKLFFVLCLTVATALSALGLSELQVDWANRLVNVAVLANAAVFVHFHTVFPRPKGGRWTRHLTIALYLVSVSLAAVYAGVGPRRLEQYAWFPLLWRGIRLYFAGAILAGLALLLHTYVTTNYGPVRRRVRLVLFGTCVALVPLVALSLLPDALRGHPIAPDEIVLLGLLAIPLAYGFSIVRHNLLGVDLVINRTLVYVSLTALLVLAYLAVVTVASFLAGSAAAERPLVGAVASLVVAATMLPLRSRVQTAVDGLFDREAYDYQAVVGDVSRRLSRTLHEENLEDLLVWQVSQAMGLRGAALLLRADACPDDAASPGGAGDLVLCEVAGFDHLDVAWVRIRAGGRLARHLVRVGAPVEAAQLRSVSGCDRSEGRLIDVPGIRLWVPLALGRELQGVLLLGEKHVDAYFSPEDHKILATLAHQAALAAKNLQLVGELRQRMAEIDADKEMLRQVNRRTVQSREAERKRLSHELHDQVIQAAIGLKLHLESCRGQVAGARVRAELQEMARQAQGIIDDMRRICSDLRPVVLEGCGLMAALHSYIDDFEAQSGLCVERGFGREDLGLPDEVAISLFRVVQEALHNVWRHADTPAARVTLAAEGDHLALSIADDGVGFAMPGRLSDLARQQHLGLVSMRERVDALGGDLTIRSRPGQGTTVHATVPWPEVCGTTTGCPRPAEGAVR